jgi:alpha-beta hydrolase superfamily lysophospholipase
VLLAELFMRTTLVTLVVAVVGLKLLVWWLEPRMAFFPYAGVQQTPSSAGFQYSDLRIPTEDGETLHGWWLEHESPRAQVIYWHGNGGNLSLWLDVVADLRKRGFSVLAVDYRGYGASTGRSSEKGIYRDGDAALKHFTTHLRRPGAPVVYWGRSLGCAVASNSAARAAPDGLILESPFPDVESLFVRNPVMRVLSLFSSYRFPTSRHLENYRGPLLVMHGEADSIIPFAAGQRVFERAPAGSKHFVTIRGADHNDSFAGNAQYWKALDEFVASLTR